jgi:hypothetical protein
MIRFQLVTAWGARPVAWATEVPPRDAAIGCDPAKHTDWTVLMAMDRKTGACVDMDRFRRLSWPIQKERILSFCRK